MAAACQFAQKFTQFNCSPFVCPLNVYCCRGFNFAAGRQF